MELPEAVRARLVSLVAASLADVTPLPPALKQVAGFAPARRARLGATAILSELERDDDLRLRVAVQVRVRASDEPGDVAALAWLERPEDWEAAVRRVAERLPAPADRAQQDREQRLRERAEQAERTLREVRRGHKEAQEALKAEVAVLRRTVGEARARERAAREDAESARAAAEATVAGLERELRQLRAQVAKLEEQAGEQRRLARTDRDEVTLRARLLLDTLNDAAVGLRRELALPGVSGSPGDRIEAELAAEGTREGTREATSTGSLAPDDPALLAHYLALPRSRLLIDGYNVTKATWASLSLEAQRGRLLALLPALVARTSAETTVVFDAAASDTRPVVASPRGVRVLFSPRGVIADDVIRELVAAEPPGRVVVVVTEDRELAADVRRAGARVVGPRALTRTG